MCGYLLVVSLLSGASSVLTPCVLPLLPAMLAVSSGGGRRRVVGLVVGVITSFTIALLVLASIVRTLGVPDDSLRYVAGVMLAAIGLVLVVPGLDERVQTALSRLVSRLPHRADGGSGFWGGLAAGGALGIVWTPCAGPILAAASFAAATSSVHRDVVIRAVAFGVGMSIPLCIIAFGGRRAGGWLRAKLGGRRVTGSIGAVLILTGAYVGLSLDGPANRWLSRTTGISSTPIAGLERCALDRSRSRRAGGDRPSRSELADHGYPMAGGRLQDLGPAPEFAGLTHWLNTPGGAPLTLRKLRGKVVLVDFWTYSCINCLRTLPHIRRWYSRYRDDGLVVVGVHAPEFLFEHDPDNVRDAVRGNRIEYPVAQDNDFRTWQRYFNRYWPAKYLVDRRGHLRYVHHGEGAYALTENRIRELLDMTPIAERGDEGGTALGTTPETYLGYGRGERFVGIPVGGDPLHIPQDRSARFRMPASEPSYGLRMDTWGLDGTWTIEEERSVAGAHATLLLRFTAADVYLVAGPVERGRSGTIVATVAGGAERQLDVDAQTIYTLRRSDETVEGVARIDVSPGIALYAFTFG